jgi:hypothetical protein
MLSTHTNRRVRASIVMQYVALQGRLRSSKHQQAHGYSGSYTESDESPELSNHYYKVSHQLCR